MVDVLKRQEELVKYLTFLRDINYEGYVNQKHICEIVKGYNYNPNPKLTGDHCKSILDDARAINSNQNFDVIITCKDYKFKIATKEEAVEEMAKHLRKIKVQAKIIKDIKTKYKLDNTFDLLKEDFWKVF